MSSLVKNMKKIALFLVSLLAIVAAIAPFYLKISEVSGHTQLKRFSSYEELKNFLEVRMEQARRSKNLPGFPSLLFRGGELESLSYEDGNGAPLAPETSTTNIQVAGVDEADIVKTDGEYLYMVSGPDIYVLKAYPPNQAVMLSKIELNETYDAEIYVNEDKLAVLGNNYHVSPYANPEEKLGFVPYVYTEEAFLKVYDITDRANPVLTRTVILNGTLSGSRMIRNYVYAVVNQPATHPDSNGKDLEVVLPRIHIGDYVRKVQPTEIRYVDTPDVFYYFTTVLAVNIIDDTQEPTHETFLIGQTALMYVSLSNMYLVVPNTNVWILRGNMGGPREETLIYRVKLDKEKITFETQGAVSGYVLNQFSMDEYNGFFRIATTAWTSDGSKNNLFTLNMNLDVVGKLKGLAPGERIYSARFMGDRCYLVTFRQIDPFFVIDVSDPVEPKVLGYLKIPGFSGYLHPYDENYIVGVGKQDNNVKLSLFNVTNVTAPTETAKYVVQADWSDSTVLMDHKAFLFDRSKNLLVIPLSITKIGIYRDSMWQGAYVFNITLDGGLVLRGGVTHLEADADPWAGDYWVKRSLYIENVLYTISDKKIKMNSLENLAEVNEVELP